MAATLPMALLELRTAVDTRLTGDETLMGLVTGCFTPPVPEGQAFPYISYGQHVDGPWPSFGKMGALTLFLLHIHARAGADGEAECYQILAEVIRLLHTRADNPPLTLASYGQVRMQYEWSTAIFEADAGVWNMPVRFRSKAQEL